MTECLGPIEIDVGTEIRAVAFSTDGEYLLSGGGEVVRVWRVAGAKDVATIATGPGEAVLCLAASKDGKWFAAGGGLGALFVWDAETYEQVFKRQESLANIFGVDFSPDSSRLVSASNNAASIWDLATGTKVQILHHDVPVQAAKYLQQGDQIATATPYFVAVWDSNDGRVLWHIEATVIPWTNTGLLWFYNHLFVVSDGKIKQVDASSGSTVSEWHVPEISRSSCITVPKHEQFIAHAANRTVTFWDLSTHTQLALSLQHPEDIHSIAFSPDDRFLAIGGKSGKVSINSLSRISDSISLSRLHPTLQGPEIHIDGAILDSWKNDQLADAEALLTTEIDTSRNPNHLALASRALVRARLRYWDTALVDAEMAIDFEPSIIGYIAKGIAHVGKGERHKGYRACDIAFEHFHSSHVTFLLLLKAIIVFMAGEHVDAISRMDDLISTVHYNSICYVVQAYMYFLLGNSYLESSNFEGAIQSFECARVQVRPYPTQSLLVVSIISGWKFDDLDFTIRQHLCEALYSAGRTKNAGESLLELVATLGKDACMCATKVEWISDFTQRCLSTPERDDDVTLTIIRHTSTPHQANPTPLLREWTKTTLTRCSWKVALATAVVFPSPRFVVYQVACERLEEIDSIMDATECFREMTGELGQGADEEQTKWINDFKCRCERRLEDLGDLSMNTRQYSQAISQYSTVLSLSPTDPQGLLAKRSHARASMGLWKDALNDANEAIALNPSSPLGYERKHAALRGAGSCREAEAAFEIMLSTMSESPDPEIRERSCRYVSPAQTEAAIRGAIQDAIRDSPLVLINTDSGRLLDKHEQASWFESQPIFHELVSSMATDIDHAYIEDEVGRCYRYAMFSHKWRANEPSYDQVVHIVVYDLDESPTHDKLQMFCKIVRDAGLHWAWSDSCCINKADPSVLQEALVSMFQWYQGSTMTVILLCDVPSPSRRGDLIKSIWNTRAWTLQEYHASKVVRFYNKDWTLYRNLDIPNHKDSPEIVSEMEEATGISTRALMALRPGLEDIREKLRLASTRQTTRVEDSAYSLLGIFSLSMPVVYGEGNKALGRLLAQLLTSSGNTSILAWTGKSGSFNSCLPANISVFAQSPTSHVPIEVTRTEMKTTIARLRNSSLDLATIGSFYDRLNELRVPFFAGKRMTLPCIIFKLGPLSLSRSWSEGIYRAQTTVLGVVEIKTEEDLSQLNPLYLIHPWIDFLLDRQPVGSMFETIPEEGVHDVPRSVGKLEPHTEKQSGGYDSGSLLFPDPSNTPSTTWKKRKRGFTSRFGLPFSVWSTARPREVASPRSLSYAGSLRPPSTLAQTDKEMLALEVIARLRQPFGALLLTPDSGNVAAYRRVATESLITVQVEEITPAILDKLVDSVRVLDVL